MSKAKEYAKKYYPQMWVNKTPTSMTKVDMNEAPRRAAMLAYEQAEKDTIERAIDWCLSHIADYFGFSMVYPEKFKEDFRKDMRE